MPKAGQIGILDLTKSYKIRKELSSDLGVSFEMVKASKIACLTFDDNKGHKIRVPSYFELRNATRMEIVKPIPNGMGFLLTCKADYILFEAHQPLLYFNRAEALNVFECEGARVGNLEH